MSNVKTKQVINFHKHIDNGGFSIKFNLNEYQSIAGITEYVNSSIQFETSYFGYPELVSQFNDNGQLTPADYEQIGMKFIQYAKFLQDALKSLED